MTRLSAIEQLPARAPAAPKRTVIEPAARRPRLDLRELWAYRELFYFLVWRDVKVRYKQTVLGAGWAVIQPVMGMLVFSLIFGRVAKISFGDTPYPVAVYSGLLPWLYFSTSLSQSSSSVVGNSNLVTKIYFPRLIIPAASVIVPLFDFLISFVILVGLMLGYGIAPGAQVLATPVFLLLAFLVAFGVGLWLAALNVRFRDVPYAIPFLVQLWLYVSPVVYPLSMLPERWRVIFSLNPMAGVIDGFRWAVIGTKAPNPYLLMLSAAAGIALLGSGLWYFKRTERQFADVI